MAVSVLTARNRQQDIQTQLADLGEQLAPGLQAQPGFGPATVAIILTADSHHGRIRSEAAFAALAGTAPLPTSSDNTIRHRLNRGGDRQLNMAFDVVAKVHTRTHDQTKTYVAKRTAQGRTYRETKRVIKRYLARSTFRQL